MQATCNAEEHAANDNRFCSCASTRLDYRAEPASTSDAPARLPVENTTANPLSVPRAAGDTAEPTLHQLNHRPSIPPTPQHATQGITAHTSDRSFWPKHVGEELSGQCCPLLALAFDEQTQQWHQLQTKLRNEHRNSCLMQKKYQCL